MDTKLRLAQKQARYCPLCERKVKGKKKTSSIVALAIIGILVLGGFNWFNLTTARGVLYPLADYNHDGKVTYREMEQFEEDADTNNDGTVTDAEFEREKNIVVDVFWAMLIVGNAFFIIIGAILFWATSKVCPICGSKVKKTKVKNG